MKFQAKFFLLTLSASFFLTGTLFSQESESIGDHFSLEGALELFKNSDSPEEFEKKLNLEDSQVNNLDLDEDGEIDYIRVIDNMEDEVHALVLRIETSEVESQDIAVIEIEKTGEEEAILQIIGDEVLYGENHILEPFDMEATDDGRGPKVSLARVVFNVWVWPSVRFVYRPGYRVWVSPYRYRNYPRWWKPWRPHTTKVFIGFRSPYRHHYRVTTTHRVVKAHRVYTPKRKTSTVVRTRSTKKRVVAPSTNKGVVGKKTTTTKTVKGPNGGKVTRKKTTTTVKGKKGGQAKKRTTTTKARKGRKG